MSAGIGKRQTIWIVDAHRDGKRFIVRAEEKLTAFVELDAAITVNLNSDEVLCRSLHCAFSRLAQCLADA